MRTKVPELQAIYRAIWNGHYWNSSLWREAFGNLGKLPTDGGHSHTLVDDSGQHQVTIYLDALPIKGCSLHRVYVKCPRCRQPIPAGRIHQHTC